MAPKRAPITYQVLTDEHRRQVLQAKLAQIENEHYQHDLNLRFSAENGANDDALIPTRDMLGQLENVHRQVAAELAKLDG